MLPAAWSHANPLDILGDADPARVTRRRWTLAADDPASDGLLAILTPQDMTDPTLTAEALAKHAHVEGKPVLASWMGGADVAAGVDILNRAGIPTFPFPDDAARTFCQMWRYADNLRSLYETPVRRPDADLRPEEARAIIDAARAEGRTLLDEHESKAILGGVWNSDRHRRAWRGTRPRPSRPRARAGLSGRAEALVANHHPQDRRRRRQAGPARRRRRARRLSADRGAA